MRWWFRLLTLSVRGTLERAVRRIAVLVVALATTAVVLVVIGSLALSLLSPLPQKRLDRRWAQSVADPPAVLDRIVPRGPSSSALRLVRAAGAIGIELVPSAATNWSVDDVSRAVHSSELGSWCFAVMSGPEGAAVPIPDAVRTSLEDRAGPLIEIITILTADETIAWELQNAMGGGAGVPTPGQLVELHRWLTATAADSATRGDLPMALTALEASWRLNQTTLGRPERELRIAGYSILELNLAILRTMSGSVATAIWMERLRRLDPVGKLGDWVLVEAYSLPASSKRGTVLEEDGPWSLVLSLAADPPRRWLLMSASESLRVGTASLSVADLRTFDPDLRYVDAHHRIPRWNRVARAELPNPWHEWLSAARADLAIQLSAEVLHIRSLQGEELGEFFATLPQRRRSRMPGAFWLLEGDSGSLRIWLDVEAGPSSSRGRVPHPTLVHVVQEM